MVVKMPHPQTIVVGGVTCVQDIINPARNAQFKSILNTSLENLSKMPIWQILQCLGLSTLIQAVDGLPGGARVL